jgi:hypothetical protein
MPGIRSWAAAVAVGLAIAAPVRAADDVPAAADAPAARPRAGRPGIDLAAHVDINVVLPSNQWRVSGLENVVIAGGGRLVIEGNLTVGGEPVPEAKERIRRTDEVVSTRLRQLQQERLAAVAADARIPADRRRSLALATEADIGRVMAEVARLRRRYEGQRANLGDEAWHRFQKEMQECRRSLADPFGADSLFAAVRAGIEPETK